MQYKAASLALVLMLSLSACGGSASSAEQEAPPSSSSSASVPSSQSTYANGMSDADADRVYLKVVHGTEPDLTLEDDRLVKAAHVTCDLFEAAESKDVTGSAWLVAVKAMTDGGLSGHEAGAVIGTAVGTYCPEYNYMLPAS